MYAESRELSLNSIIDREEIMKPMIWHPEAKDGQVNAYLDRVNHAPYEVIALVLLGIICLFTSTILLGIF
jgi:hypothetical protein